MGRHQLSRDLGVREGKKRFCLGLAAILIGSAAASATDFKWKDRGDRYEGIRPENTSGGDFELLAVYADPGPRARPSDRLWVSVPLRHTAELTIRVWEPKSGYAMVPTREIFKAGNHFSWSRAAVLEPKGIESGDLHVLATDAQQKSLYYPARLTTARSSDAVTRYVFRFRSRGGVDFAVTIARENEGRLEQVLKRRREENFGGILDFTWDGRDATGKVAAAGVYHLKLDGTVFLKNDLSPKIDLQFAHYGAMSP